MSFPYALILSYLLWCTAIHGEYTYVRTRLSPADAQAYCTANFFEGKLATIHSVEENTAAAAVCEDFGQVKGGCLIGLIEPDDAFMDGTAVDYTNWAVGEPTDREPQGRYVISGSATTLGQWYNVKPERMPFICQYISDRLLPGEQLCTDEYLQSSDGRFQAVMQADGNFVVYDTNTATALWHTETHGNTEHRCMVYQTDGNFVMYNDAMTPQWATYQFTSTPGAIIMQTDGNLVAYDSAWNYYWHTNTYQWSSAMSGYLNNVEGVDAVQTNGYFGAQVAMQRLLYVLVAVLCACIALNIWLQCNKNACGQRKARGYSVVQYVGDSNSDVDALEAQQLKV